MLKRDKLTALEWLFLSESDLHCFYPVIEYKRLQCVYYFICFCYSRYSWRGGGVLKAGKILAVFKYAYIIGEEGSEVFKWKMSSFPFLQCCGSREVSVADPETSEGGGARNMKYKPPRTTATFLAYFLQAGGEGAWPPCPPPDPLLSVSVWVCMEGPMVGATTLFKWFCFAHSELLMVVRNLFVD